MVFAGARKQPTAAISDVPNVNTKAEEKAAEKAPVVDTEEKPKRRRKK